mmetsp:Transcript_34680/g.108034  ORF Transcript_34680/g.108034 Transcript_34680/m.108034 type:complete len:269 (+) Transcript_34680:1161-1967(+)
MPGRKAPREQRELQAGPGRDRSQPPRPGLALRRDASPRPAGGSGVSLQRRERLLQSALQVLRAPLRLLQSALQVLRSPLRLGRSALRPAGQLVGLRHELRGPALRVLGDLRPASAPLALRLLRQRTPCLGDGMHPGGERQLEVGRVSRSGQSAGPDPPVGGHAESEGLRGAAAPLKRGLCLEQLPLELFGAPLRLAHPALRPLGHLLRLLHELCGLALRVLRDFGPLRAARPLCLRRLLVVSQCLQKLRVRLPAAVRRVGLAGGTAAP